MPGYPYPENLLRRLRFMPPTDLPTGCIEYTGGRTTHGYGHVWVGNGIRDAYTHRVAYEMARGPVPAGMELDHLCHNPPCCNPAHLEPVTHAENMARSKAALKTHCNYGHELTEENTYRNKLGQRSCQVCRQERNRRRYQ